MSRSQWDHMWSNRHFCRHFLIISGMHGLFKWNWSQVLISRSAWHWQYFQGHGFKGQGHRQCTYLAEAYLSVVHDWSQFRFFLHLCCSFTAKVDNYYSHCILFIWRTAYQSTVHTSYTVNVLRILILLHHCTSVWSKRNVVFVIEAYILNFPRSRRILKSGHSFSCCVL